MNAGPYETERDARAAAERLAATPWPSELANHALLLNAIAEAGVYLGAYDHRIIEWIATWEDATCAVVAGLISRAHAAGQETGGPGTAQPGGGWISGPST